MTDPVAVATSSACIAMAAACLTCATYGSAVGTGVGRAGTPGGRGRNRLWSWSRLLGLWSLQDGRRCRRGQSLCDWVREEGPGYGCSLRGLEGVEGRDRGLLDGCGRNQHIGRHCLFSGHGLPTG